MENTSAEDVAVFEMPRKEEQTEHYEMLVLYPGSLNEDETAAAANDVKIIMESFGAVFTSEENTGRRALAYTISQNKTGTYIVYEFNMPTRQVAAVNEKLRIHKQVLRFLIVKKAVKTAEQRMQEKERQDRITARKKVEIQTSKPEPKSRRRSSKPRSAAATAAPADMPASSSAPEADKKPLENLDQEIEKLLSDDITV